MKRLLIHICCAPDAIFLLNDLKKNYEVYGLFYNPNIYPVEEYNKRKEEVIKVEKITGTKIFYTEYEHSIWSARIKGFEAEPEGGKRCNICFEINLDYTAKFAYENKFSLFATTLTISPHKDADIINQIGLNLSKKYNIEYLVSNFKKNNGFLKSVQLSKRYNLYRQHYCGCPFSIRK